MNKEEFIERFLRLEAKDIDQTDPFMFLSSDRCLGIRKDFKEEKFSPIAKLKLKAPRLPRKTTVGVMKEMGFHLDLLYRAMRVLRKRKKFQLGLYEMPDTREVFAIREGENLILIAPYLTEEAYTPLADLVTSFNKKQLKKWMTWSKILRG